jgi:acyl-CoA thioesterase-1
MSRFLFALIRTSRAAGLCLLLAMPQSALAEKALLVLGDSISAAYGMSLEQGWVSLLAAQLRSSHPDYTVVNASISGETTGGGLRRLPDLLAQHRPRVVVLELGGNDGLRGHPPARIRSNLLRMAELAEDSGATVLLLPMEIPPNYGKRYTAAFRESFAAVAQQTDARLGPFILDGIATDAALMQDDGIHPTAAAQPLLLDNIIASLLEIL